MIHQIEVKKTDKTITNTYKIVYENNEHARFIAREIAYFLKRSCGLKFAIVQEDRYRGKGGFLSVGQTALAKKAGIVFDGQTLGNNGFCIKTVGNNVYMGGCGVYGTVFSGYEFLAHTVGFEAFNQNVVTYESQNRIPLPDFNVVDRPDFEWRHYDTEFRTSTRAMRSLRFNSQSDLWIGGFHSFFEFIPPKEYLENADASKNHPKWFSHNKLQLCLNAWGDEAEKQALVETLLGKFKERLKKNPNQNVISFTQEDACYGVTDPEDKWCQCPVCRANKAKFGTNAATMIQFTNILGERLEQWIKTNDEGVPHDRKVDIVFFAYTITRDAPVKADGNGNWQPIDESVRLRDNVCVYYAPIGANYTRSFRDPENAVAAQQTEQWRTLSKRLYVWLYQTNFGNYLYPYNSWETLDDTYRFFHERKAAFMYSEGQYNQGRGTAFNDVKLYLDSQLLWNITKDKNELFEHYFEKMYGPAKPIMKKYFDEIVEACHGLERYEEHYNIYFKVANKQYWTKEQLTRWLGYCDEALLTVKPVWKQNRLAYKRMREAIEQEAVFPRYALLTLYAEDYDEETLRALRKKFYRDCERLKVDWVREPDRMKKELKDWRGEE